MSEEKELTRGEQLRRALVYERKNGWDRLDAEEGAALEAYCTGYKQFLDAGKTERECVDRAIAQAEAAGFRAYVRGMELKPGDRIYQVNRDKAIMLAVMGQKGLEHGVNIGAAHIDSPRLDLKQNPLYESDELGFFKTHYYGGIRKYQWVTIPLELHGVVALKNGEVVRVSVGNGPDDPMFTIDDLLPHLATDQVKKPLGEAIPAESLNILVGSRPLRDDEGSDRVKLSVLELLNRKYGIVEEDFLSAELCAVPAFRAVDIGFDRSLIGAYGHDDRVCAFAALKALLDLESTPTKTAVCVLADKEEIGSDGVTGMKSAAFDTFMEDLCEAQGVAVRVCYENSFCLSTDVTAAFDPNYPEAYEKRNAGMLNYGIALCKYTGSRGKGGSNDANAEFVGQVRKIFDEADVLWQIGELGKVDQGGGGTVALDISRLNADVIDVGVPVLSMHSPFEVVSKLDVYMAYKAFKAYFLAE